MMTPEETLLRQANVILNSPLASAEEREVAQLTIGQLQGGAAASVVKGAADTAFGAISRGLTAASNVAGAIGDTVSGVFNQAVDRFTDNITGGQQGREAFAQNAAQVQGAVEGFFQNNPGDTLSQTVTPQRLAELEGQGVIAPGTVLPSAPLDAQPVLDSIANFGTTISQGAQQATPNSASPGGTPLPSASFDAAGQDFFAQQLAQSQVAQIQNALAVDELNRAQAASGLVLTPQTQFNPAQLLGNAALGATGVPATTLDALGALQQLQPSANIASVQPAINANASQQRSVNSQVQGAERDRTRAIAEAQELSRLRREQFIKAFAVPVLSQPRT